MSTQQMNPLPRPCELNARLPLYAQGSLVAQKSTVVFSWIAAVFAKGIFLSRIRIVTWNIHKGIGGLDRRYRLDRIVTVLHQLQGDILFLQEVDEGARRSRRDRQVDVIGDALGLKFRAYYPNHKLREGHYGNATLSHLRMDHHENINLKLPLKKSRGAVHSRISFRSSKENVRFWLFNVHLGLAGYERVRQLRRLLSWIDHHRLTRKTAIVLGGDMNDVWGTLGRRVLTREGFVDSSPRIKTFPSFQPVRPLDRVFLKGPIRFERVFRSRMKLATQASDHLPLVADVVVSQDCTLD